VLADALLGLLVVETWSERPAADAARKALHRCGAAVIDGIDQGGLGDGVDPGGDVIHMTAGVDALRRMPVQRGRARASDA
jgi:hypothetical protein